MPSGRSLRGTPFGQDASADLTIKRVMMQLVIRFGRKEYTQSKGPALKQRRISLVRDVSAIAAASN